MPPQHAKVDGQQADAGLFDDVDIAACRMMNKPGELPMSSPVQLSNATGLAGKMATHIAGCKCRQRWRRGCCL